MTSTVETSSLSTDGGAESEPAPSVASGTTLQPGTLLPTHGRSMKEQKAWLMERAAAHRKKAAEQARTRNAEAQSPAALQQPAVTPAAVGLPPAPAPPPPGSDDPGTPLAQSQEESDTAACDPIQALKDAGGDVAEVAQLSGADLTVALKGLGFKGLATRKKIEAALKTWHTADAC